MSNSAVISKLDFTPKPKTHTRKTTKKTSKTSVIKLEISQSRELMANKLDIENMLFSFVEATSIDIPQGFTLITLDGTKEWHKLSSMGNIHQNINPARKVGAAMGSFLSGFPLVSSQELKKSWTNFTEVQTFKAFFVVIGGLYALLLGDFNKLHWALLVFTSLHFILRLLANKHKGHDDYVSFSRSVQLFLWPYILLAVGNVLSDIISFDGLPEGTFLAIFQCWLIWGELKGFVQNAETCGLPVPPILTRIVKGKKDFDPPF